MQRLTLPTYLAFKEILRNKGRFLLVSMVIALITLLVLFIAALGEGLGNGNREYISKVDAQLIVYQAKADYVIAASRLGRDRLAAVRRVDGVADAGMLGTSSATLILPGRQWLRLKVALLGVEAGHAGEPPRGRGRSQLSTDLAEEVIIDRNTALRSKLALGDPLTMRVTQGTQDEFFKLRVVGISRWAAVFAAAGHLCALLHLGPHSAKVGSRSATLQPRWPMSFLVRLQDPAQIWKRFARRLSAQVDNNIETATLNYAITQACRAIRPSRAPFNTQGGFTLLIGVLVIGGFFQIQILQKVAQIGVLKAIGTANLLVAAASVIQIVVVTVIGVAIGGAMTYLFSLTFPPTVPIVFNGNTSALAVVALLLIGPLGGLVSIRYAVQIEPLKALGLG